MTSPAPAAYSPAALAARWEVSAGTIYAGIKKGKIPHFRPGSKLLKVPAWWVDQKERECASNSIGENGQPSGETVGKRSDSLWVPKIGR